MPQENELQEFGTLTTLSHISNLTNNNIYIQDFIFSDFLSIIALTLPLYFIRRSYRQIKDHEMASLPTDLD